MIRLVPSIFIASLITFLFFNLFDKGNISPTSHSFNNFLVSISFINPTLLQYVFKTDFNYINGSYWSLWPEIQFYFFAGILYFLNKD